MWNASLPVNGKKMPRAKRKLLQVPSCGDQWFSAARHAGRGLGDGDRTAVHCEPHGMGFSRNGRTVRAILFLAAVALMAGCSLMRPYGQTDISANYNILAGNIRSDSTRTGSIVVAAYEEKRDGLDVADYAVLHESGPFELMVPRGSYHVLAFRDENEDLLFEANEARGIFADHRSQCMEVDGISVCPDIVISDKNEIIEDCPFGLGAPLGTPEKIHTRPTGEIADLQSQLFDEKNGIQGYWSPEDFLSEIGANIVFLEAYDPEKIPVLFIHGATGTPRGWRRFIESMDRTRFQPWFYYYPSGAPVKSMSNLLFWKLLNLRKKYGFSSVCITAHSMGGLIARSFLTDFGERFPFVRLFLSISTPWGGDKLAEYGVQQSPVVIPCWYDMQPDGDFLKSIYERPMPEGIDFYLFFGYRGNRNPFRSNNDRTISLASLLDQRSQSDAKMIFGFNEDHDSILFSNEVLLKYNTILNTSHLKKRRKRSNMTEPKT